MIDAAALLQRPGFDLDTAVFLAQASAVAYWPTDKIQAWAKVESGFAQAAYFDSGNVQGYWCATGDVALLAFRGTSNPGQWLRDARFFPASYDWGRVHIGFRNGLAEVDTTLADFDAAALAAKHVWLTGHSLGGALALIAAARLKMKTGVSALVHTYGQPSVGLNDFAERFSVELPGRLWRFVNQSDIVTRVPPWPYRHTGTVKRIVKPGMLEAAMLPASAPLRADADIFKEVTAGGAALESANAVAEAGVAKPQFIELDAVPLSDLEFSRLQLALGAAAGPEATGPVPEIAIPLFADHAISDCIRLLRDIRDGAA
jgi:triacylglycerol lipase